MGSQHCCASCGHGSNQWFGRCPACGSWNSAASPGPRPDVEVATLACAALHADERLLTTVGELDSVLGGGIVAGSVILLAGEPGIGKSTLVLQAMAGLDAGGHGCLLVTGEESAAQVALRARRLGLPLDRLAAAPGTSLSAVIEACRRARPDVVVVDSVQALRDSTSDGAPGSVRQVRDCAAALTDHAKATGTAVVLVGHVTKDGAVAGPKVLEHVVDAVVTLEGQRSGSLRVLRAAKNRFGSCEQTGVLQMRADGLRAVPDPSALLLADRRAGVPGSVVFPRLEGTRAVLVEIQALVSGEGLQNPRRVAQGVDARRLALLLGVLRERAGVGLGDKDVFVAAAGGLDVREPAADLAVCLALFSAAQRVVIAPDAVALGEVGLGGEVRRVPGIARRCAEAARHGFRSALLPSRADASVPELRVECVDDLARAFAAARRARVAA